MNMKKNMRRSGSTRMKTTTEFPAETIDEFYRIYNYDYTQFSAEVTSYNIKTNTMRFIVSREDFERANVYKDSQVSITTSKYNTLYGSVDKIDTLNGNFVVDIQLINNKKNKKDIYDEVKTLIERQRMDGLRFIKITVNPSIINSIPSSIKIVQLSEGQLITQDVLPLSFDSTLIAGADAIRNELGPTFNVYIDNGTPKFEVTTEIFNNYEATLMTDTKGVRRLSILNNARTVNRLKNGVTNGFRMLKRVAKKIVDPVSVIDLGDTGKIEPVRVYIANGMTSFLNWDEVTENEKLEATRNQHKRLIWMIANIEDKKTGIVSRFKVLNKSFEDDNVRLLSLESNQNDDVLRDGKIFADISLFTYIDSIATEWEK